MRRGTSHSTLRTTNAVIRRAAYPNEVSQSEGKGLLHHGASVMDAVQQGAHQLTWKHRKSPPLRSLTPTLKSTQSREGWASLTRVRGEVLGALHRE